MGRMRLLNQAVNNIFEGFCIIKSVQVKVNSKGSDYLDLILADCEGEAPGKLWDYNPMQHGSYEADQVVKVRGSITLWKEAEQLKVDRIRPVTSQDDVDMSQLVPCAPFDSQWMYDQLYQTAEEFQDPDLCRLAQYLLRTNKERLLRAPAAVKLHHATRGGLLHHTLSIVQLAREVCKQYPALDSDLVYAGAILHDIAKLDELEVGELGVAGGYSVPGQLLGHINMGVDLIGSTCELLDIPQSLCMLVQHMLLSHHGVPEFGSPRPPMFPEAEVLSELDMLDSRMYEMFDALAGVPVGGFSERIWALDNRQLYQHGHGHLKKS